jgi:hypothetical protein
MLLSVQLTNKSAHMPVIQRNNNANCNVTQEVVGSIPAQCKHLCSRTCLFVLGLGVYMYNMYAFTKKNVYKYVFIRYLESIIQAL